MADDYNINISANVKIDEVQKLIAELNALTLGIADLNKTTLSGVQRAMGGLASAGTALTDGLKIAGEETNKLTDKTKAAKDVFTGFYMELGAMGARLATQLPNAVSAAIKAFGAEELAVQKLSTRKPPSWTKNPSAG